MLFTFYFDSTLADRVSISGGVSLRPGCSATSPPGSPRPFSSWPAQTKVCSEKKKKLTYSEINVIKKYIFDKKYTALTRYAKN
jgi:hypothetical protein